MILAKKKNEESFDEENPLEKKIRINKKWKAST